MSALTVMPDVAKTLRKTVAQLEELAAFTAADPQYADVNTRVQTVLANNRQMLEQVEKDLGR